MQAFWVISFELNNFYFDKITFNVAKKVLAFNILSKKTVSKFSKRNHKIFEEIGLFQLSQFKFSLFRHSAFKEQR